MTDLDDLDRFDPVPVGELALDPGIRRYVLIMRANGVETFESCQGGDGHPCPEPFVRFFGNRWAGFRAFEVAMTHGLPVLSVAHEYNEVGGWLEGPTWRMTFRHADPGDASLQSGALLTERVAASA